MALSAGLRIAFFSATGLFFVVAESWKRFVGGPGREDAGTAVRELRAGRAFLGEEFFEGTSTVSRRITGLLGLEAAAVSAAGLLRKKLFMPRDVRPAAEHARKSFGGDLPHGGTYECVDVKGLRPPHKQCTRFLPEECDRLRMREAGMARSTLHGKVWWKRCDLQTPIAEVIASPPQRAWLRHSFWKCLGPPHVRVLHWRNFALVIPRGRGMLVVRRDLVPAYAYPAARHLPRWDLPFWSCGVVWSRYSVCCDPSSWCSRVQVQ